MVDILFFHMQDISYSVDQLHTPIYLQVLVDFPPFQQKQFQYIFNLQSSYFADLLTACICIRNVDDILAQVGVISRYSLVLFVLMLIL